MLNLQTSSWSDIGALRAQVMDRTAVSIEDAAQSFATQLAACSPTVVLARVFIVLPLAEIPEGDRAYAAALAKREHPRGHLAIPLLGRDFVQGIPMIAKLLSDLEVSFAGLDDGKALDTRRLLGSSKSGAFFVPDARIARDDDGRQIIPARDFVEAHDVRTVFGMGGAYGDGTLTVAVVFTSETIERVVVDRFPSLIVNFKMATASLRAHKRVYRDGGVRSA